LRLSPLTRRFVRFRRTTSTLGRRRPLRRVVADVQRSPGSPLWRDRAGVGRPYFFPFFADVLTDGAVPCSVIHFQFRFWWWSAERVTDGEVPSE